MHYNGDGVCCMNYDGDVGSALIFVCLMYGTGVVSALDEQRVCCIAVCVRLHWAVLPVIDAV